MRVLHRGTGEIPGRVYVRADERTVRFGRLPSAATDAVAALQPNDVVTFDTVSHEGLLGDQGADPVAFFTERGIDQELLLDDVRELTGAALRREGDDGPHVVLGPVTVRGASPGDVLCVEPMVLERRVDYGVVSNRHQRGVLAGAMPELGDDGHRPDVVSLLARVDGDGRGCIETAHGRALRFDLRPFLGLVGITPDDGAQHSSTPPGPWGGNLDVRHLGAGSRLFLPVQVDGAGLYVGDPHFAQGNGEVALTAFEAPLRATLRVSVLDGSEARALARLLAAPWGETRTHTIIIGLGATLDDAMRECTERAVAFVEAVTGADRATALAFLSAAADFEISQAVNIVVGVHCMIRTSDVR
jgi:acetamidase/formamidase